SGHAANSSALNPCAAAQGTICSSGSRGRQAVRKPRVMEGCAGTLVCWCARGQRVADAATGCLSICVPEYTVRRFTPRSRPPIYALTSPATTRVRESVAQHRPEPAVARQPKPTRHCKELRCGGAAVSCESGDRDFVVEVHVLDRVKDLDTLLHRALERLATGN